MTQSAHSLPQPFGAAAPAGMTLYRLHTPTAIGQVLQDMQSQRSALSVFVVMPPPALAPVEVAAAAAVEGLPTQQADDAWPVAGSALAPAAAPTSEASAACKAPDAPLAKASLQALDVAANTLCWHIAGLNEAPPTQLLGVAYMAGGVRVQCQLQGAWQPSEQGGWQLEAAWPAEVLQLQRRRYPRLSVPLGHNYSAGFLFGRRHCELDIDDLSLAGVALRGARAETAMLFMGRKLANVSLYLADGRVLQADLQVRSRRKYQSFLLGEQMLVGCSIEHMSDDDRAPLQQLLTHGMWAVHTASVVRK